MLDRLIPILDGIAHRIYIEPFGGSGVVMLNKTPSKIDVINDIDDSIVNVFRVLRNPEDAKRLQELLDLTPYAASEWRACSTNDSLDDPIEKARRYIVRIRQSFGGTGTHWGRNGGRSGAESFVANTFARTSQLIPSFTERFRHVQIECADWAELITKYDHPHALFYLDPPYVPNSRTGGDQYDFEMGTDDHHRLIDKLLALSASWVLSGYLDSDIHAPLNRDDIEHQVFSQIIRVGTPDDDGVKGMSEEHLWIKRSRVAQDKLPTPLF